MTTACQNGYMRFEKIGMRQPCSGSSSSEGEAGAVRRDGDSNGSDGSDGRVSFLHAVQMGWTILDVKFCNTSGAWGDGVGDGAHRSIGNAEKLLYSSWDHRIQMVHLNDDGMPADNCDQTVCVHPFPLCRIKSSAVFLPPR